jgi:cytochrome c oxidase accessory protein FixG
MVISRHVSGKFRNARTIVESVLALIYFGIPWMTFNGSSLVRLDIPTRKFYLLGNIYIPQEGIYLHLFLGVMGLSLFFFTSLIGRVWCGWACPQTVFTDFFDFWGRLILGKKYGKKDAPLPQTIFLHFLWIAFSLFSSFHFIAYFVEPGLLIQELSTMQFVEGSVYPYFLLFFAGLLYLDMTLVREQFCKYACPYARFQTVMMDEHSFNVTYDYKRGEPRRNKQTKIGDCTACNMCLVVCPTGIDIRDGVNVGCIACAKCVDACTIQMAKENKKTLIGYTSLQKIETNAPIRWLRTRTVIYGTLLVLLSVVAIYLITTRVPLYARVLPDRVVLPTVIPHKQVRSFYNLHLINMDTKPSDVTLEIENGNFSGQAILRTGEAFSKLSLKADSETSLRLIIETSNLPQADKINKKISLNLLVKDASGKKILRKLSLPLLLPDDPEMN